MVSLVKCFMCDLFGEHGVALVEVVLRANEKGNGKVKGVTFELFFEVNIKKF